MAIKLPPPPTANNEFDAHLWQDWLRQIQSILGGIKGTVPWSTIDFSGSNLTDITTRRHNDLQVIQGGAVGDYQHLTTTQVNRMKSNQVLTWLSM